MTDLIRSAQRLVSVTAMRVFLVAAAAGLLVPPVQAGAPYQNSVRLSRTFVPPSSRVPAAVPPGGFTVTRADFFETYAFGLEIHIGLTPDGVAYPFDVGFTDDPTAKSFVVPDVEVETIVWTLTDPADTPYAARYPGATHALVTMSDPAFAGVRYQFYTFEQERLVFDGYLDVPAGGGDLDDDRFESVLSLFPLDATLSFSDSFVWFYDDEDGIDPEQPFPAVVEVGAHGFGDLLRPDGTSVPVGAFFDDLYIFEPDGSGELFDSYVYYSIFAADGTWLYFEVTEGPDHQPGEEIDIQGDIWIDGFEYWEVVNPNATAGEAGPATEVPWSLYPNPTADVVRFSEPLTATVFDVMGRAVREANRAREIDLRGLASGTYVVRSDAGQSRRVTVRR